MHRTPRVTNDVARGGIFRLFTAVLLLGFSVSPRATEDVDVIVQRWTAANRRDFEAAQHYSYFERIRNDNSTKTYVVTMVLGSPYTQLVEEDGKVREAQQRLDRADALELTRRQGESPDERRHRVEQYRKNRERAHRILEEVPRAFDYKLRSTRRVNAQTFYVLSATPRRGYDPPNVEASVLAGMQGEFWIDVKTGQLSRGWARVLRPVSIEGFLATIQPGTEFEVEQRPVGDGIWLPTHFSIHSRSRIVHLFHHHTSQDRTFFNYHAVPTP